MSLLDDLDQHQFYDDPQVRSFKRFVSEKQLRPCTTTRDLRKQEADSNAKPGFTNMRTGVGMARFTHHLDKKR